MFYHVFQKNIKNINSKMSLIMILVIEYLICALLAMKISYTYLYPLRYDMVSLKLTNNQNAISAQKVNSLKHYTNKPGAWNSSFSREKSTLAEQYLA